MPGSYIIAGCRTPIGKFQGALAGVPAPKLGAIAIREAIQRAGIEPNRVDEVIMGNVLSAGLGQRRRGRQHWGPDCRRRSPR